MRHQQAPISKSKGELVKAVKSHKLRIRLIQQYKLLTMIRFKILTILLDKLRRISFLISNQQQVNLKALNKQKWALKMIMVAFLSSRNK